MKALLNNSVFVLYTFLLVSLQSIVLSAQCPTIISSSFNAGCIGAGTPCTLCANQTITLSANGINLPNPGCIKWYYSQTSGFNPYNNEGTLIGCGTIAGNNSANVIFNTTDAMCNNGVYYVVGIIDPLDQTNCTQVFTTEYSFQVDCPVATISAIDSPYCERYPIYFSATGGASYHWEGPYNFNFNIQNPILPYANYLIHQGVYYVTVTDALGCTIVKSKNIEIGHITLSTHPFPPEIATFCDGDSTTIYGQIDSGGSGNYIING